MWKIWNKRTTICLGKEYDERLRKATMAVLKEMGAVVTRQWRGHAGSQEVEVLKVTIHGQALVIEAETYMGLSVKGEQKLVEEVATRVRARLASPP